MAFVIHIPLNYGHLKQWLISCWGKNKVFWTTLMGNNSKYYKLDFQGAMQPKFCFVTDSLKNRGLTKL